MFQDNILLLTDSYKQSHYKQYPPNTTEIYSHFESRGGEFPATVFFGLQYFLKQYLSGIVVTEEKIKEAEEICKQHFFGNDNIFNRSGWEYILKNHGGILPLEIKAVPEGSKIPVHNILMSVRNTDPNCYWLTNFVESLLVQTWYPTTVATISHEIRQLIWKYLNINGDVSLLPYKLHDFGFRGVSSVESAGIGGAAHLINFRGTDTIVSMLVARDYYNAKYPIAESIPASEHSTITSWMRENEVKAFENMLTAYPEGFVAIVSDSFNIYNACEILLGEILRDKVLNRNGTVVIRPDSGYPPEVVVKVLNILGEKFGYRCNNKGFKVLNDHVRVIQGDGVDFEMINKILTRVQDNGWSADNIAFGMGGALLQKLNRDTQKFAFKCSAAVIDGQLVEVYKEPITDKEKNSKPGKLKLVETGSSSPIKYITVKNDVTTENLQDVLQTVFLDGMLTVDESFETIRTRNRVTANRTIHI